MKKLQSASGWLYALWGALLVVLLTALDQYTKILAQKCLKNQPSIPLIKNILELKYLYPENRGIAFGMFQGKVAFFVALSIVFFVIILYIYVRLPKKRYYFPLAAVIFLMISGALGNFIDRVFRGYVIDFIYVSAIDFPVFNLADIYVVSSGILLVLFVCIKYKDDDFEFLNPRYKG